MGCGSETTIGPQTNYFQCSDTIGCQRGFSCDLVQQRCVVDSDFGTIADLGMSLDGMLIPDAGNAVDANVSIDAEMRADASVIQDDDGDGVDNDTDNCDQLSNPDQLDTDADGLGDICDTRPDHADFQISGHFLLFGGLLVDDTHSLQGRGQSAHGVSTDGEFNVRGGFRP